MATGNLISWIGYWDRASNGPAICKIHSLSDMKICRTYNPSMQGGLMWNVTDQQMWSALQEYRKAA